MPSIVDAAERAALEVIDDAEKEARRYLDEAEARADLIVAQKLRQTADELTERRSPGEEFRAAAAPWSPLPHRPRRRAELPAAALGAADGPHLDAVAPD